MGAPERTLSERVRDAEHSGVLAPGWADEVAALEQEADEQAEIARRALLDKIALEQELEGYAYTPDVYDKYMLDCWGECERLQAAIHKHLKYTACYDAELASHVREDFESPT